jgi:subtilisin family serine protease
MKEHHGKLWLQAFLLAIVMLTAPSLSAGRLGPHLDRVIESDGAQFAGGTFANTFQRTIQGKRVSFAHVFIEAETSTLTQMEALGAEINTITSSRIMTATVPVKKMRAIAALTGVYQITAAQPLRKMMNLSAAEDGVNLPETAFPRETNTGAGVLVGVIDTGIDIEHPDFINEDGSTRVLSIWDHTLDSSDVGGVATPPADFTYGTEWSTDTIQGGYTTCAHRDNDGHGTHVAGTAAGNGRAPHYSGPYTGLAPEAELLIVKFDFDNEKNRNSETSVIDAINWIFQKATELGKPCVINMSMGSDYGPHDGSTAEERGLDDLTGAGKIICLSAGNAGSSWSGPSFDTHGGPIHGSGNINTGYDIVFTTPGDYAPSSGDDYIFFDLWYPGTVTAYVQITTPGGTTYPQSYSGPNSSLWFTDGKSGGFGTPEGFIYVENVSGANSFWAAENSDNNIYIEISDYQGAEPASGTWVINIITEQNGEFEYHSWQGYSDSLKHTFFWYDSDTADHTLGDLSDTTLADNTMTIGKPATALSAISIGAYQTKDTWPGREYEDCEEPDSLFELIDMTYTTAPITYYNDFFLQDLAYFSSRGPSRDGRTQPFISAPGVGIVASLSQTNLLTSGYNYFRCMNRVEYGDDTQINAYYTTLQGTSMSSPHATGSVAVLLEAANNAGIQPTPTDMKEILSLGARADSFTVGETDTAAPNNDWGYGKVDVTASLEHIYGNTDPPPSLSLDDCVPDSGGWRDTLTVNLTGSGFAEGAAVSFGSGITVTSVNVNSESEISCTLTIAWRASRGSRDITVTNTDGQSATLISGFTVTR